MKPDNSLANSIPRGKAVGRILPSVIPKCQLNHRKVAVALGAKVLVIDADPVRMSRAGFLIGVSMPHSQFRGIAGR